MLWQSWLLSSAEDSWVNWKTGYSSGYTSSGTATYRKLVIKTRSFMSCSSRVFRDWRDDTVGYILFAPILASRAAQLINSVHQSFHAKNVENNNYKSIWMAHRSTSHTTTDWADQTFTNFFLRYSPAKLLSSKLQKRETCMQCMFCSSTEL